MEEKNHKIVHLPQQKGGRGRLIEVAVEYRYQIQQLTDK